MVLENHVNLNLKVRSHVIVKHGMDALMVLEKHVLKFDATVTTALLPYQFTTPYRLHTDLILNIRGNERI